MRACRAGAGNGRSVTKFDGCRDLSGGALFISAVSYRTESRGHLTGSLRTGRGVRPPAALIRCAGGSGCLAPPGNRAACRRPCVPRSTHVVRLVVVSCGDLFDGGPVFVGYGDAVRVRRCARFGNGAFHISVRSGGRGGRAGSAPTTSCPLSMRPCVRPRVLSFFRRPGPRFGATSS